MISRNPRTHRLDKATGRWAWLRAQRLDVREPFGEGAPATAQAVAHLGYVQIDTINVIERSHHHILHSRIPSYRRSHLHQAQTVDKTVFEYWTHALSYLPAADFRFFRGAMDRHRRAPARWFAPVLEKDARRVLALIRRQGPLSIRDFDDQELVDKDHPWASRKPSKRALQLAFFNGALTVSERVGMVKTYDLVGRHFGWDRAPKPASERETVEYLVERGLRSQGLVTVASVCFADRKRKPAVRDLLETKTRNGELIPVRVQGAELVDHWGRPEVLSARMPDEELVHLLSPFDPLVIQRDRLEHFFRYRHQFEAYLPEAMRRFGYFALPVLVGDRIVAAIDLKTDRERGKLLLRRWTWVGTRSAAIKKRIEAELDRFERFQLDR